METKNYTFKIDFNKWKTDLDALLAARADARAKTEKKNWSALDSYYDPRLTKMYCIRAHSRGRIHRKYAYLNWSEWTKLPISIDEKSSYDSACRFTNSSGVIKFLLTLDDQAAYIGDSWKEYIKNE